MSSAAKSSTTAPRPRSTIRCTACIGPEPVRTCIASRWLTVYSSWRIRRARSSTSRSRRFRDRVEPTVNPASTTTRTAAGDRTSSAIATPAITAATTPVPICRIRKSCTVPASAPAPDCSSNRCKPFVARARRRCRSVSAAPTPATAGGTVGRTHPSASTPDPPPTRRARSRGPCAPPTCTAARAAQPRSRRHDEPGAGRDAEADPDRRDRGESGHATLRPLGNTRGSSGSRPSRPRTTTPIAERPAPRSNVTTPPPDW